MYLLCKLFLFYVVMICMIYSFYFVYLQKYLFLQNYSLLNVNFKVSKTCKNICHKEIFLLF
jgi:hypothetical protein